MRWIFLAVAAFAPLLASAQDAARDTAPTRDVRLYAFASVGTVIAQHADLEAFGFDRGPAVDVGAGIRVTRHLAVEVSSGFSTLSRQDSARLRSQDTPDGPIEEVEWTRELTAIPVLASARASLAWRRFEAFAVAGGGISIEKFHSSTFSTIGGGQSTSHSDVPFVFHAGGGASVRVVGELAVGVQARYSSGTATFRRDEPPASTTTQSAGDLVLRLDSLVVGGTIACRF